MATKGQYSNHKHPLAISLGSFADSALITSMDAFRASCSVKDDIEWDVESLSASLEDLASELSTLQSKLNNL